MAILELIQEQIRQLYKTNPKINLNVSLKSPKITIENTNTTNTGVYPHIFQIEEYTSVNPRQHTLQYTEVLLKILLFGNLKKAESDFPCV